MEFFILSRTYNPNNTDSFGYIACGNVGVKEGLVIEFNEAGTELRRATAQVSAVYNPANSTAVKGAFRVAFKTNDGGILAFGTIYNKNAPLTEKAPDWSSVGLANSELLNQGIWIVKFSKDLKITSQTRVRGVNIKDGWQTSDDQFIIAGMDANLTNNNVGNIAGITLLRRYNQIGGLVRDQRDHYGNGYREISSLYKFPESDTFVASTPDRLLRINGNNGSIAITNVTMIQDMGLPEMQGPYVHSISPASSGGVFISANLRSVANGLENYNNGFGFYRLNGSNVSQYHKISKPGVNRYTAPMLLPGNNNPLKYIGVQHVCPTYNNCGTYIYELTDNGTFTTRIGKAYPLGTVLTAVSTSDGFFTCGSEGGNAKIAKMSTCANFKVSNMPPKKTIYVPLPQLSSISVNREFNYSGAKAATKAGVKYSLTARVASGTINGKTTGEILEDISKQPVSTFVANGDNGYGKIFDLNRTYNIVGTQAKIEYTIIIHDTYITSGVTQSCDQSDIFHVEVELTGGTTKGTTSICYNTAPNTLTVEGSGGGVGITTYQWQSSADGLTGWKDISGATTETYTPEKLTATTHYKRAIVNQSKTEFSSVCTITVYPQVIVSNTQKNVDCKGGNNGSISLSGGTQYRFHNGTSWSTWGTTNTFENLSAKTYKIQAKSTDGCTSDEKDVIITEPALGLTISTSITNASCANTSDGKVEVTVNGGTPDYEYSKDGINYTSFTGMKTTLTGYAKGTHTLYIKDAQGCVKAEQVTVQKTAYPTGDVVAKPTFSIDEAGTLKIKTSIKNIGDAPFINPFKIIVYKNAIGSTAKHVYSKPQTIAIAETTNIEIEIPKFTSDPQWSGCSNVILNFNDSGDGSRNQQVCDETVEREYELVF